MQTKWMWTVSLLAGLAALSGTAANAQTDVAASLYGAFTGATNENGTIYSPANAAGGLLEVRHIAKPWAGYEGTYAYNRANETYSWGPVPSGYSCPAGSVGDCTSTVVSANAHEVTGDWVVSVKVSNFRPFALAGGGVLFDVPSSGQFAVTYLGPPLCPVGSLPPCASTFTTSTYSTASTTKPVFVYGAGVDWKLLPHIGLRLQYWGNLYKAPNLTTLFYSTGAFTHTAEPMIGVYFRL